MAASWGGGRFRGSVVGLCGLSGLFRVATQLNKPKKPDEPNKRDEPASRHAPRDLGLQDPQSLAPGSLFASTSNETNKNHHDRDDQEGMNESAHGVRGDNTQKPEDNHDDCDGLEHVASPFVIPWPIVRLAAHCRLTDKSSGATREAEQGSLSNLLCASLLRSPRRIYHSVDDVRALCEGRRIQRQSIWCAGLSCLSRSSNHTHETDRRNQMNQIPAPRGEMVSGTLLIPGPAQNVAVFFPIRNNFLDRQSRLSYNWEVILKSVEI